MSKPPKYQEFGQNARDLYFKNYGFGEVKVDLTTTALNGLKFSTSGNQNILTGAVFGNLETLYESKKYGIQICQSWNTKNVLSTNLTLQNPKIPSVNFQFEGVFSPDSGDKSMKFTSLFSQESMLSEIQLDFFHGPSLSASTTYHFAGVWFGFETQYNLQTGGFTKKNLGVTFSPLEGYEISLSLMGFSKMMGCVYHRISEKFQTCALLISTTRRDSLFLFGVGAKLQLDSTAILQGRIDNKAQLGISFCQQIRQGVKITLSALVNGKRLNADSHKMGFHLSLES
eukprot:Sdes_comp11568_c0_seq1m2778